jgi:hypothetical protein
MIAVPSAVRICQSAPLFRISPLSNGPAKLPPVRNDPPPTEIRCHAEFPERCHEIDRKARHVFESGARKFELLFILRMVFDHRIDRR